MAPLDYFQKPHGKMMIGAFHESGWNFGGFQVLRQPHVDHYGKGVRLVCSYSQKGMAEPPTHPNMIVS